MTADLYESAGTGLPCQVTDEAANLKVLSYRKFKFLMRLDCLFFDNIGIPAIGIINNEYMYRLATSKNKEALAQLYGESGSEGGSFLRPIVLGEAEDTEVREKCKMKEAARRVVERKARRYLEEEEQLYEHAEFIDAIGPTTYFSEEPGFRCAYWDNLCKIVHNINAADSRASSSVGKIFKENSLSSLEHWLEHYKAPDNLGCTDVYRHIDENFGRKVRRKVKILAASIWMYTMCDSLIGHLGMPREYIPFVQYMRELRGRGGIQELVLGADSRVEDLEIGVPLDEMAQLPLRCLVEMRKLGSFTKIRGALGAYRLGKTGVEATMIQKMVEECKEELLDHERHWRGLVTKDEKRRVDRFILHMRNRESAGHLRVIRQKLGLGVVPAIYLFVSSGLAGRVLAACILGGHFVVKWGLRKLESGMINTTGEPARNSVRYSVVHGSVRGEKGRGKVGGDLD